MRSWPLLALAVLLMASGALGRDASLARRKLLARATCTTRRQTSAIAVSIVFATCEDSLVLAAQSIASAAATGCSDTIAAAVGVSIATLAPAGEGGINTVTTAAFATVLTAAVSTNSGAAVSDALALAIASGTPSYYTRSDMLSFLAQALAQVTQQIGCTEGAQLALAAGRTLLNAAPDLLPQYQTEIQDLTSAICPEMLTDLSGSPDRPEWLEDKLDGRGVGHVKRRIFSRDYDKVRNSATVAVTIAQAACPTAGSATVGAVAIATAYQQDKTVAVDAIAGVLGAGVDVTPVVTAIFTQQRGLAERTASVQALASVLSSQSDTSTQLLGVVAETLNKLGPTLGCDGMRDDMSLMQPLMAPGVWQQMCGLIVVCPGMCV